jgi:hypothetical protein
LVQIVCIFILRQKMSGEERACGICVVYVLSRGGGNGRGFFCELCATLALRWKGRAWF